jgi:hypothetical protein
MNLLYALVMTLTINGQTTEYVIDKNMSAGVCFTQLGKPATKADTRRYKSVTIVRDFSCMKMTKGERF